MKARLLDEWTRIRHALRRLDKQTTFVLIAAAALVLVQHTLGSRQFFWRHLDTLLPTEWRGLGAWGWWFGMQGVTGFLLPVACLLVFFQRTPRAIGLGRGDIRLALIIAGLYLPVVAAGTWVLSDSAAFQTEYPHYDPATERWSFFLIYEALFLFYWIGWEYLWRGFVLFGTAPTFGLHAIIVQAMPFALLHLDKPLPEALLSIVGGVALGALVWRCRSFWIAVPIHAAQMLLLDLWCTLRVRTGADGIGLEALGRALGL